MAAKNAKDDGKFEDKQKALDAALSQIEKQFGKGAVMKLGDNNAQMQVEVVPSGSLSLDLALGVGGVPKGRIVEVYGPESSGKTTVALHMVAEVQKRGGIAGYVDAEHAMDPTYAKALGVDIDNLYISQPDDGEQALEIAETMVRSGAIDIVIVEGFDHLLEFLTLCIVFRSGSIAGIWCKETHGIVSPAFQQLFSIIFPGIHGLVKLKDRHQFYRIDTQLFQIRDLFHKTAERTSVAYT